jgi:hypothetical protein
MFPLNSSLAPLCAQKQRLPLPVLGLFPSMSPRHRMLDENLVWRGGEGHEFSGGCVTSEVPLRHEVDRWV